MLQNPHPTDLLLDTSVFSPQRLNLTRDILLSTCRPILLPDVLGELQDINRIPALEPLRALIFPDGSINIAFQGDRFGVLESYPKVACRYFNLLRWRRQALEKPIPNHNCDAGQREPTGKARTRLIRELLKMGIAEGTIKLANKKQRSDRVADERLAVFAVFSPILTGRDCFLLTADDDILEQVMRLSIMLFDDYGAYLIARDFRLNGGMYTHRHAYRTPFFAGEAEAIGRQATPDYLLPPSDLTETCATTVINVNTLKGYTWVSARNMEPAIAFQENDPLGRKGDPGDEKSIQFSEFGIGSSPSGCQCKKQCHFIVGTHVNLKLSIDDVGPIPVFDLTRAMLARSNTPMKQSRIVTPFAYHQERALAAVRFAQE